MADRDEIDVISIDLSDTATLTNKNQKPSLQSRDQSRKLLVEEKRKRGGKSQWKKHEPTLSPIAGTPLNTGDCEVNRPI